MSSSTLQMHKEVVHEQELPDLEEAKRRVKASVAATNKNEDDDDDDLDGCPHLRTILPCKLSLDFVEGTKGVFIKNPIHALHLQSQFDRNESIQDWLLYGDEHEKSIAMQTAGYSETWHPALKNDYPPIVNPPEEEEVNEKETEVKSESVPAPKPLPIPPKPLLLSIGPPKTTSGQLPMKIGSAKLLPKSSDHTTTAAAAATASAPPATTSANPAAAAQQVVQQQKQQTKTLLPEAVYQRYTAAEQKIRSLHGTPPNRRTKRPKLLAPTVTRCTVNREDYAREQRVVGAQLILQLEHFRQSRERYWKLTETVHQPKKYVFGDLLQADGSSSERTLSCHHKCCCAPLLASDGSSNNNWDSLLQCLECSHVGCLDNESHSFEHWLTSGHNYAVSCGAEANVFCFRCGSFVSHTVFSQERDRVDLCRHLPWLAWKEHPVQRSFDAFWFSKLSYWKGMRATYPLSVPDHHVQAAQLFRKRQLIVQKHGADAFRPQTPVGMYNLGNTCFMSSILQVMIHCPPLQSFFLTKLQHHCGACLLHRKKRKTKADDTGAISGVPSRLLSKKKKIRVCLACELDKVFLEYTFSSTGMNLVEGHPVTRGTPLVTSGILTSAWKCSGMSHLAGYEQRDAHEFLHAFLEIVGQHIRLFRTSVSDTLGSNAFLPNTKTPDDDEITKIFGGMLRSVLVCHECGNKRSQSEPFFSLSLPLSKEVQLARQKMNVERCLKHFTLPETLADPVACPACAKKTTTKKQHVISKLPKVLCLHLKRFDAAHNRKIEDFVAFPTKLNMGQYLPHWSEVTLTQPQETDDSLGLEPLVLYDLFATVNHFGNLQSGHYITNAKVGEKWWKMDDSRVTAVTLDEVMKAETYMLFYGVV